MTESIFHLAIEQNIKSKFQDEEIQDVLFGVIPVWAEVLEAIVVTSQTEFQKQATLLHVDLQPELVMSLINTAFGIAEKIVESRTIDRNFDTITEQGERDFYRSNAGQALIAGTSKVLTTSWVKRYQERWKPKSEKKLEREKTPPLPKRRNVKAVEKNHFISRFFLENYWTKNGVLTVQQRVNQSSWRAKQLPFGKWGYEKNLYSDRLEDRFGLIEGDAEEPICKVINVIPLNDPERLAFFGYLIVQKLRNPFFRNALIDGLRPISIREVGREQADNPIFRRDAYETIFENNDLYDQISRPLFWSKWVMLRATNPQIVLPDTACILAAAAGRKMLVAPLTPQACFIASGLQENEKRVLPYEINNDELATVLSNCLIAFSENEFVSHEQFSSKSIPNDLRAKKRSELFLDACDRVELALQGRE